MDKQEIHTILNSLDIQVSMGRIDQPTYDTLKQKWQQQLLQAEKGTPMPLTPPVDSTNTLTSASFSRQPATEVLACPKCAAPAQISDPAQDLTLPLRCPFCDTVYTLRQGQDNAQQLKKELIAWFNKVVVSGGYSSSSVDMNARRYIFSDSLYPILKKEVERRLEAFDTVLEVPLIQLKETTPFREYQPGPLLLAVAQGDNQWLKTLVSRLTAEQLQDFAVVPEDQRKLQQLQLRLQSLIFSANIAQQLASPQSNSYQIVKQNIVALQQSYQPFLQANEDEHYRSFIVAQNERVQGALLLVEAIISAFDEQHGIVPERLVLQVSQALMHLEKSQQLADACAYNPLHTVSLQHGIKKDIVGARIFQAVVSSYEVVTRTQTCVFSIFYRHLMKYVHHLAPIQDAEHLLWLLTSISRVLTARAGEAPLPVIKDWQWLGQAVSQHRRAGILGFNKEQGEIKLHFFHPYWVARLNYTTIEGKIVKKANVREGLLLVDATNVDAPLVVPLLGNNPALPIIQEGAQRSELLEKQIVSLPALMTRAMAERAMRNYTARQHATVRSLIGIVYLPVAVVQYRKGRKQREQVLSLVQLVNQHVEINVAQTMDFFRTYMV